jgi:hypothetical protein
MRRLAAAAVLLTLGGCLSPVQPLAVTCQAQARAEDPDEEPTTQGHDRSQAIFAACMQARGFIFDWSDRRCDHQYPTTIMEGRCYRRPLATDTLT